MILTRNLSGVPSIKPTAKGLAQMQRQSDRTEMQASLPTPITQSFTAQVDVLPVRNTAMDDITKYFAAKRSLDEAQRSVIRASQNAKMESLVGNIAKTTLKTYTPSSAEVQEAFFQSKADPQYFEKQSPNKELMKALAALYVEKGLMLPKELTGLAGRPRLSFTDEAKVLDSFRDAVKELEDAAVSASSVDEYNEVITGIQKVIDDLENTSFSYNPEEKVKLLQASREVISRSQKEIEDATTTERERVAQLEAGKKLAEDRGKSTRASKIDTKLAAARADLEAAEKKAVESSLAAGSPMKGLAAEVGAVPPSALRPKKKEDTSMVPTAIKLAESLSSVGIGTGADTPPIDLSFLSPAGKGRGKKPREEPEGEKIVNASIRAIKSPSKLLTPESKDDWDSLRAELGVPEYKGGPRNRSDGFALSNDEFLGKLREEFSFRTGSRPGDPRPTKAQWKEAKEAVAKSRAAGKAGTGAPALSLPSDKAIADMRAKNDARKAAAPKV